MRAPSVFQCGFVEFADTAVGAADVGKRECIPVAVGVGGFVECGVGMDGTPVAAVVGGDVGAVGAYGDPGFAGGVVGYGGAVAVGRSCRGMPCSSAVSGEGCRASRFGGLNVIAANGD